jgi:hypothetical protein
MKFAGTGLAAALLLSGCSGRTSPVTGVTQTVATLHGSAKCASGNAYCWFDFGYRVDPNGAWKFTKIVGPSEVTGRAVNVSATVTGLHPNTTYDVEICGLANQGTKAPRQSHLWCTGTNGTPSPGNITSGYTQFTTLQTAPSAVVLPTLTGSVVAGQTLSTTPGDWTSDPTGYSYGWELCDSSGANCAPISGQSSTTYEPAPAEAGDTIRSVVRATNKIGSTSTSSAPSAAVAAPSWNGSFSSGDWSHYGDCQADNLDGDWPTDYAIDSVSAGLGSGTCEGDSPNLVHAIAPPIGFTYAGAFTVRSNDQSYELEAGERTMDSLEPDDGGDGAAALTQADQGTSTWYRDEVYFPAGFQPTLKSDFNWMFLVHNYPNDEGDDMLSCGLDTDSYTLGPYSDGGGSGSKPSPDRFSCRIFGGGNAQHPFDDYDSTDWYRNPAVSWAYDIGLRTVQTGVWYDMVWHIDWDWRSSASGGNGSMTWWIDGQRVATYTGPTLLYLSNAPGANGGGGPNQGYLQTGYYRPTNADAGYAQPTDTVYHAGTMIGPTCTSIGEPGLC